MGGKKRIAGKFASLREKGEKGLISYVTAGYPNVEDCVEIVRALADHSDLIEIGIPFSDPVADGPIIQNSSYQALVGGIKQADIFKMAAKIRSFTDLPILFMTYYNPVIRSGIENFVKNTASIGIDGLIVPDLPVEEDDRLRGCMDKYSLSLVPLAAPTSTGRRLEEISRKGDSFIYCVSVTGVTGSSNVISSDLNLFSERVRKHTSLPLAVGFGISGPEIARRAAAGFDAVVVGSAIVKAIDGSGGLSGAIGRVSSLAGSIKEVLINGGDDNE
ncbi:MAG: tryptophan synthase subunit alpha [Bacillota bacterium]